jgi:Chalcone isomerase-like
MFPARVCVLWTQRQLLLVLALSLLVESMECLDCPKPNRSNFIQYVEVEGIQIPLEKSFMPWSTTNNSDACSTNMNTTAATRKGTSETYYLNGAGLRSFSLFHGWGGHIKIYVASLYRTTLAPLSTMESIYNLIQKNKNNTINTEAAITTMPGSDNDTRILFEFTFLRNVNQRRVTEAWKHQLHHSVSKEYTLYPEYQHDYNTFIHAFGPIKSGGIVSIALSSNGHTYLFDPGYDYKHTIIGYQFQLAFVSMWVGTDPVTIDLKNNLLGNGNSSYRALKYISNVSKQEQMHHETEENVCTTKLDE